MIRWRHAPAVVALAALTAACSDRATAQKPPAPPPAVPVMLAATLYELAGNPELLSPAYASTFLVGFVVAFVSAFVVVKAFVGFVSRSTFAPFAWYRIIVGALLLAFYSR